MPGPLNIDDATFETEVKNHPGLVLVDFWAPWCGPCRLIAPVLEELAAEYAGRVKITKVNVDENQPLAGQFGIKSIPTLLLFKDGNVVEQIVGAVPKQQLATRIDNNL